ncbi:MAG: hypothetical protein NC489_17160 [Ruminococcus flavefaciens]|nr:hypothetical protein [Ruminococcus flavefaciens]
MIQKIKSCRALMPYLKSVIEDEGIEVEIDSKILPERLAIIKIDDYYNDLHTDFPPKSVDFVVVVDCTCSWYVLYLLELKNVNSPKKLKVKDIQEKFENTIGDFLSQRFAKIFLQEQYKYKDIKLFLVSDAYGLKGKYSTYAEYKEIQDRKQRIQGRDSLRVDFSLGSKLFRFREKIVRICYDIPPNPIIQCIS